MRIVLIALGMLISVTAAQAQLLGPSDTPESIAAVRKECAYQPDPARCYAYLDHYAPVNRGWSEIRESFNSGFQHGGPMPTPVYVPAPQYVVQQQPRFLVRRPPPPPPPMLCWHRGRYVPCR